MPSASHPDARDDLGTLAASQQDPFLAETREYLVTESSFLRDLTRFLCSLAFSGQVCRWSGATGNGYGSGANEMGCCDLVSLVAHPESETMVD